MQIVSQLEFGPFATQYHRDLVDDQFKRSLEFFLQESLLTQLDLPATGAEGTFYATFDKDQHCGPNSLVRNFFTLEITLIAPDGNSELKSDIEYQPDGSAFVPRTGHNRHFYLWTPARQRTRENELEAIQRLVDDFGRTPTLDLTCPICGGRVRGVNDPLTYDVRCIENHCFQYNYHKDDNGDLAHGHFFTRHPEDRA